MILNRLNESPGQRGSEACCSVSLGRTAVPQSCLELSRHKERVCNLIIVFVSNSLEGSRYISDERFAVNPFCVIAKYEKIRARHRKDNSYQSLPVQLSLRCSF